MKRKIFISAGHSSFPGRDRGAAANGYIEGLLAAELRSLIIEQLRVLGAEVVVDNDNSILQDTLNFFRSKTSPSCIVLDIHFNAGSPSANGTETLIPGSFSRFELHLAKRLSDTVHRVLGIRLRQGRIADTPGVKTELESHHGRLGWMRLTGENVLMEICFITNTDEMARYQNGKLILARHIAMVLFEEAGYGEAWHTVKSGETLWGISRRYGVTVTSLRELNSLQSDVIVVGQQIKIP